MNASEIRYIEEHLESEPKLPLSAYQMAAIVRRAHRERAEALAGMFSALGRHIAGFYRSLREYAASHTGAGLRHG